MYDVRPLTVIALLLFYVSLFIVIRAVHPRIDPAERKTFFVIGAMWAILVFISNYLLYLAGLMSFLPWVNNFMHTFLWIGFCLAWLYLGVRDKQPMWAQFVLFATFSLVVKVFEQTLFGTWDHGHFFQLFQGNHAYVLGWSLADGLYPPITLFGLRLLERRVKGLVVL